MGALQINDYKPYLSDQSLLSIADSIAEALDSYNKREYSEEFNCENGFVINVEAVDTGFNFRRLQVTDLQVNLWNAERQTYCTNEDCERYATQIKSFLWDSIYKMNSIEEEKYEQTREYQELW